MMRRLVVVFIWLTVRGAITQPLFAQRVSPLIQQTNTQHFTLASGATIRIDNSFGELNIEGWNQPDVEITVIKTLPYDYAQSKAERDLNAVQVKTDRKSDAELVISTSIPKHDSLLSSTAKSKTDVLMEYQIHAPSDLKLVIHHGDGSVHVNNMSGNIEANSSRGDIIIFVPGSEPSIDAKTQFGAIASDFGGEIHRAHLIGRSFISGKTSASPLVHLRMGYGGITVKTLPREAYTANQ
jgi:hypothetical protein